MVLDDPEFFLVTSVSIQVNTLNVFSIRYGSLCWFLITLDVFSIRYIRYTDFHRDQKNPVSFVSYCKWLKGWFIINFAFVTFVTFVTWY